MLRSVPLDITPTNAALLCRSIHDHQMRNTRTLKLDNCARNYANTGWVTGNYGWWLSSSGTVTTELPPGHRDRSPEQATLQCTQ